jgi:ubiquinone/menaquinone biosynthesis C-methylase UbiE
MSIEDVRKYYESFGEREWLRLESPEDGAVEYAVTTCLLEKHLSPRSQVLDIGGGPGRYTIWLTQRDHRVVLADLSPKLLEIARGKIAEAGVSELVAEITEANVCDLSRWGKGDFDVVLCLGPYYHLPNVEDRQTATLEIARVLRPGGLLFVAMMPRIGFLRRTLAIPDESRRLKEKDFVDRVIEAGVFENDIPGRFTSGYGFAPGEVEAFFDEYGFSKIGLYAAEGITIGIQRSLHELAKNDPETYKAALDLIVRTADEPSILGMAAHLLYIGRKGH